jgi:hypothetical protein
MATLPHVNEEEPRVHVLPRTVVNFDKNEENTANAFKFGNRKLQTTERQSKGHQTTKKYFSVQRTIHASHM